jgi:hypothetical protein
MLFLIHIHMLYVAWNRFRITRKVVTCRVICFDNNIHKGNVCIEINFKLMSRTGFVVWLRHTTRMIQRTHAHTNTHTHSRIHARTDIVLRYKFACFPFPYRFAISTPITTCYLQASNYYNCLFHSSLDAFPKNVKARGIF